MFITPCFQIYDLEGSLPGLEIVYPSTGTNSLDFCCSLTKPIRLYSYNICSGHLVPLLFSFLMDPQILERRATHLFFSIQLLQENLGSVTDTE